MHHFSVAVVGGDLRFVRLCKILTDKGIDTWAYGINHPDIPKEVHIATSLEDISKCQYVIGPIPFTRDGKNLFTPLSNMLISIEMFMENMTNSYLCLSVIKPDMKKQLDKRGLKYIDMMEMDEVAILNAIPTQMRIGALNIHSITLAPYMIIIPILLGINFTCEEKNLT